MQRCGNSFAAVLTFAEHSKSVWPLCQAYMQPNVPTEKSMSTVQNGFNALKALRGSLGFRGRVCTVSRSVLLAGLLLGLGGLLLALNVCRPSSSSSSSSSIPGGSISCTSSSDSFCSSYSLHYSSIFSQKGTQL